MTKTKTDTEIVRPKDKKKSESFAYCKWAMGDWEARFYIHTPTHVESREATIKSIREDPAWVKRKTKVDARQAMKNNKAKGKKR